MKKRSERDCADGRDCGEFLLRDDSPTDRILGFTWNRLYQGINVHTPSAFASWPTTVMSWYMCLAPQPHGLPAAFLRAVSPGAGAPHIAAGINLNFWPAGPIFRLWGRSLFAVLLKAINFIPPFP